MTKIDFGPLLRTIIGFDQLAGQIGQLPDPAYPPYNIERVGEDGWSITLAVAGFAPQDLSVEIRDRMLHITGRRPDDQADRVWLHRGIAARAFERRFVLAEHVRTAGARIANGLLVIDIHREVPEAAKARSIEIRVDPAEATAPTA